MLGRNSTKFEPEMLGQAQNIQKKASSDTERGC